MRRVTMLLLAGMLLTGCNQSESSTNANGGEDSGPSSGRHGNQNSCTDHEDSNTDSNGSNTDSHGSNTDHQSTDSGRQDDDNDRPRSYTSQGGNGYLVSSPKNKAAYLYSTSLNVPMDDDDHALEFPYDQLDFELYTEFGQQYPLKTGTYILGDTDSERLFDECSKCVLYWPGTVENGDYDGTYFGVGGTVKVEVMETGHFRATFENLVLERVVDDLYEPLPDEERQYYRDDQLVITMPKAVIDLDYFHKFDCDNNNCTDTDCKNWAEIGNAHCTYNEVL